jgi:Tol biopolymer transport system component
MAVLKVIYNTDTLMKKAIFLIALIIPLIFQFQVVSGIELIQLTTNETNEYNPAWSPDGTKIAYVGTRTFNLMGSVPVGFDIIWLMDSEGKNYKQYADAPMIVSVLDYDIPIPLPSRPTWSPDGGKMVFGYDGTIYLREPRFSGTRMSPLTPVNDSAFKHSEPAWSPDGIKIAFTSYRSGNKDIWLMNDDGSNIKQLTTHNSIDEHPAWSPDATKIAFTSYRSGNADIWIMDRDGSNLQQLTTDKSKDFHPAWSPDGSKIAFVSDRSGNNDIWVMSSDGKNAMQLTINESRDESPAWWPISGKEMKIAFASDRAGNEDIWLAQFGEDVLFQAGVGTSPINEGIPIVSPDVTTTPTLPPEDTPDWTKIMAIIGVISVVIASLILIFGPGKIWEAISGHFYRPKLIIEFNGQWRSKDWQYANSGIIRRFSCLNVRNDGKTTAKGCAADLRVLKKPQGSSQPDDKHQLHWADIVYSLRTTGSQPIDLGPGEYRRLDVAFALKTEIETVSHSHHLEDTPPSEQPNISGTYTSPYTSPSVSGSSPPSGFETSTRAPVHQASYRIGRGSYVAIPIALSVPLQANQAYLPPGTYEVEISVTCHNGAGDKKVFNLISPGENPDELDINLSD